MCGNVFGLVRIIICSLRNCLFARDFDYFIPLNMQKNYSINWCPDKIVIILLVQEEILIINGIQKKL